MAYYNSDLDALFIHIPKTHGTTIRLLLEQIGFCNIISKNIMDTERGTLEVVLKTGKIDPQKTFIFSFIREPRKRFISGCNYCKTNPVLFGKTTLANTELAKRTLNVNQYWHIVMSQIQHITIPGKSTLGHMNFIGICETFTTDWKRLLEILTTRGLNLKKHHNVRHTNKSTAFYHPRHIPTKIGALFFKRDCDLYCHLAHHHLPLADFEKLSHKK